MKKLLIALLAIIGVSAFAPKAEAGQYARVWNGHCYTYAHKSQVYGSNWDYPSRYRSSHYRRPVRHYYSQPVRHYRSYDRYDRCEQPVRYYNHSRPRIAVSFGF